MLELLLALLTTATVGVLLVPLLRTRHQTTDRLDHELALYRDQLAEVERERAAGALGESEAAAARTEIERRILAAADKSETPATDANPAWHKYLVPALSLAVPLLALGIYLQAGRPGLPSAPFEPGAVRHGPVSPQQQIAQVIAQARARLAEKPDDPEALSALAEALTMEANGTVTKPALDAFTKALAARPDDVRAHYYLGLHEAQSGDSRAALARWLELEARSQVDYPGGAPWLPMLRAEIQRVAKAAGVDPQTIRPDRKAPPAGMPQPSREQMEAMQNLTPEQRQQAIRGMVDGLEQRLQAAPDDRDGWLRLANARSVLGDHARAADAFARADALKPLETAQLADWAESHVRQVAPGAAPSAQAVAVLERLEKAEPRNALALFYLGAASLAAGDKPAAARRWKTLLAMLPADAPIRAQLEERIREADER
jgi:cytochrome c-type biogenesis protein CcmH